MPSLKFSAPYNNELKTINDLAQLDECGNHDNRIDEIYFSDSTIYGSGRIKSATKASEVIQKIHKNDMNANLVISATCDGPGAYTRKRIESLMRSIEKLYTIHQLESVTVANPLLIQAVKNRLPNIRVVASVLAEIDSVQRAMFYDKLGADTIIPDRDINRDINRLKEIKEAISADIRIMVNEGCMYRCPYRLFHFNFISHASRESRKENTATDHFFNNCHLIDKIDPSQVLKSNWIRPEDVNKYKGIAASFKIAGRTRSKEWILNTTKAYLEESYDDNMLDIMDSNLNAFKKHFGASIDNKKLETFHEKVTSCDKNCHRCRYCENVAEKLLTYR